MERVTIAAIATPQGSGGIGIIRVSGNESFKILKSLFKPSEKRLTQIKKQPTTEFRSHRMYLGHIIDPQRGNSVDEVLVVAMKAPRSYTMEDVVEIQSHSGFIVLDKIMKLVLNTGARMAEPGEFTKRAFLNGRIDLTQAEAVIDIVNAKTRKSLEFAAGQLNGELGENVNKIRSVLLAMLAEIEIDIDFPGDAGRTKSLAEMVDTLQKKVVYPLETLISGYENNHYFRDGIKMVVVGRPNVGKSSLLNRLTQKERAIVTEIPGTTRDTIEEMISINGLPVIIVDTAGLQDTDKKIEKMGIERTYQSIRAADIILFVIDLTQDITPNDQNIYKRLKEKTHIIVMNKVDLSSNIDLPDEWEDSTAIKISALRGINIDSLKNMIYRIGTSRDDAPVQLTIVPNLRQFECLKRVQAFSKKALCGLDENISLEFAAIDIRDAVGQMDEVLGLNPNEDVLDLIFNRFCIGK